MTLTAAPPRLTAADVATGVRRHFGAEQDGLGPEWASLDEFSLLPGAGSQRCDLFFVRAWSSKPKGHERVAVEIKVSRSDLLSELKKPWKAEAFMEVSHRFYLATPPGLVKETDPIPEAWGLLEVSQSSCRKVREAPRRDAPLPLPERALVEAFRRAGRAETRIRGAAETVANDPARIPYMAKQLTAAQNAEHRARQSSDRDRHRLHEFLSAVSNAGGWLCECGKPMKKLAQGLSRSGHRHADNTDCDLGYAGRAVVDLGSLAARLGISDAADGDAWSGPASSAERLIRLRQKVDAALVDPSVDLEAVLRDVQSALA